MNIATSPVLSRWAGVVVVLLAAIVYLLTLDNGLRPEELVGGDLITHQYAQIEARPSNAPGYPIYTMGGWLWFQFAKFGLNALMTPVQILSAYSMLWGLASLAVLYLILLQVTHHNWPIAALLTAFHAITFFFWYYSVTTEQYTSAVFQTVLLIWLAFRWDNQPRDSTLLWMAFVSGTMLANMVTTLFIVPPLLWFVFFKRKNGRWMLGSYLKRPGLILAAIGAALAPLLSYGYIYVRGAQHSEWRGAGQWSSTWDWFITFVTIQQGRDELAPGLTPQNFFTAEFPSLMWHELTLLVFWGGLAGLLLLERRRAIFLTSTLLIYAFFCWGYRFGNWFQVIIPAYPIFTIGFGVLVSQIDRWANRQTSTAGSSPDKTRFSRIGLRYHYPLLLLLLTGLVIFRFTTNISEANQRNQPADTGLDPGWAILADQPETPAVLVSSFEERLALQYLAAAWNRGADLPHLNNEQPLPDTGAERVYITRGAALSAGVNLDRYIPQAAGKALILLAQQPPAQLPVSATNTALEFGELITLAGWEIVETSPSDWQIALYWQTARPLPDDYTISVRPLAGGQPIMMAGTPIIQDHEPVWGFYPTSRWAAGSLIRDMYTFEFPQNTSPSAVQIVIYQASGSGFENVADQTLMLTP